MKNRLIPAIIWSASVGYAILSPGSSIPNMPFVVGKDKIIHFTLFMGLVFLWSRVWNTEKDGKKKNFKLITNYLVFGVFFAIFTEYLQVFVPGRSFDPLDMVANFLGGTLGAIIFVYLNKRRSALV